VNSPDELESIAARKKVGTFPSGSRQTSHILEHGFGAQSPSDEATDRLKAQNFRSFVVTSVNTPNS
jgi:hypothetical protein